MRLALRHLRRLMPSLPAAARLDRAGAGTVAGAEAVADSIRATSRRLPVAAGFERGLHPQRGGGLAGLLRRHQDVFAVVRPEVGEHRPAPLGVGLVPERP
jgi:hypothetical protein